MLKYSGDAKSPPQMQDAVRTIINMWDSTEHASLTGVVMPQGLYHEEER